MFSTAQQVDQLKDIARWSKTTTDGSRATLDFKPLGEVWDEETRDDGNWMREGATSFTISGESELPKFPDLQPEDYSMYYGAYQYPNLLLNLHPDCVMYYIGYPKGPDHTTVVSEYLFRPETIADPSLFAGAGRALGPDLQAGLGDLQLAQRRPVSDRAFTTGSTSDRTGSCTTSTSGIARRWDARLG
jgi:hypothetical protein